MKFVFDSITNPTVEYTPYGKGSLVDRRCVYTSKGRGDGKCRIQKLVVGEIVPSVTVVVNSTLPDIIILNIRLH